LLFNFAFEYVFRKAQKNVTEWDVFVVYVADNFLGDRILKNR